MTQDGQALVVVTGGARGIGAAVVDALVGAGTPVVIFDIEEAPPRHGAGAAVWSRRVDVSDESGVADAVADIENQHGPVSGSSTLLAYWARCMLRSACAWLTGTGKCRSICAAPT